MDRARAWIGPCLACLTWVAWGCSAPPPPPTGAPVAPRHVGRDVCASCHAAADRAWQGSHHDLAMQEVTPDTVLGDFNGTSFTYHGVETTFSRRDGKYFVRTDGPDGGLTEYEVAYTFGVEPLQQYLIEFPGGRYQALNVVWDSHPVEAGGQRWFHLYPDENVDHEDVLHWTGPFQNWNYMCAECHSTRVRKGYDPIEDAYETEWFEIDVSCEACHGPGSDHVAWARADEEGRAPLDPSFGLVVQLKNTDRGAWVFESRTGIARRTVRRESHTEIETCARCHSRRTLLSEDYVHGAPLLDTHRLTLLEENLYHADGQILGEVYVYGSFIQSKMYREGVTCGDCHDPHSLELRGTVQTVCGRCHLPAKFDSPAHHGHTPGKPGARCIDCHMPKRSYMVVDPRGDHSFRVPRPDLTAELGTPNACNGCHEDMSAERAADEVARLHGPVRSPHYAEALHAGRLGLPRSDDLLWALAADADQPGLARATALQMLGRRGRDAAGPELRRALVDRDPLVRLGALTAAEGVVTSAIVPLLSPLLDDPVLSVRIEAARILASSRGSLPPERRARLDLVLAEYERAQEQSADRPEGHLNLGLLHLALGHAERAEAEYELAIARQATFLPAFVNLADLYRAQGREADGERVLRQALAIEPLNAEVHHALGLLLVRRRRLDEALVFLESSTRMRPDALRYAYVYGVGLHSAGRTDAALVVLEAAHARHPADRDLLAALASIHLDAGSIDSALPFARELQRLVPDDPSIADLVRRLEAVPR